MFIYFLIGKTHRGTLPALLLKATKTGKQRKLKPRAHSSLCLLHRFCSPITVTGSALQEPQPCWKQLPRHAESAGAGWAGKGQKEESSCPLPTCCHHSHLPAPRRLCRRGGDGRGITGWGEGSRNCLGSPLLRRCVCTISYIFPECLSLIN